MAAHRAGIKRVILPSKNKKDVPDIPEEIRNELEIFFCSRMEEVLNIALGEENIKAKIASLEDSEDSSSEES